MVAFKGVWTQSFWKAVSGEFVGTLVFVLFGLGSTIRWTSSDGPQAADLVLISLCFGYGIVTMAHCFGHISGAHLNPAVTVALLCTRKISLAKSVFYILAQCLGAIFGAGILYLVTPSNITGNLGATLINERLSIGHGLLIELLITFQLVFTVCACCDPKNKDRLPASSVGISVAFGHLFAINYTGASMNPARSLGPAVIVWKWDNHWIYWIGPIIGGICAGAAYDYIYCPDTEFKKQLKEALKRAKQKAKGKYSEVDDNQSQVDDDEMTVKPGTIHVIDIEHGEGKKRKDSASEILSTV